MPLILDHSDTVNDLILFVVTVTYILWSSGFALYLWVYIQSNLDYSKCQGPPDFLRIIGSSNFRNRYFSEMFGSFRSVLIFDCISIKNGEQGIISYL